MEAILDYSLLLGLNCVPYVAQSKDVEIVPREADDDPHRLARVNLQQYAETCSGRTLRYWRDEWYVWRGKSYRKITEKELRAKVSNSIKREFDRLNIEDQVRYEEKLKEGKLAPDTPLPTSKKVTQGLITNVIQATAGMEDVFIPSAIETMTWLPTREKKPWISCENGIIDLDAVVGGRDDFLIEHSPDWFSTVCLPYNFEPHAQCPRWEAFLERNLELDPERIKMLQEWAGYLLLPDTGFQQFLVLEGEGANGKSVYCAAMEAMLGSANVSHVALELFGDKFELTPTLDRLVNVCGDAGQLDKVAEGHIKAFTAGNPMSFGRKYLDPIERAPTARLMMAVNNRPRFSDKSDGVWRRMLLVPWLIQIPVEERVANMDKPWWWSQTGELPGILMWAIKGLHRLRQQGKFTRSELCDRALMEYRTEMNPVRRFLEDHIEPGDSKIKCHALYQHYVRWCKENGHQSMAEQQFGKEVFRTFRKVEKKRQTRGSERFYFYEGISYTVEKICGGDVEDNTLF